MHHRGRGSRLAVATAVAIVVGGCTPAPTVPDLASSTPLPSEATVAPAAPVGSVRLAYPEEPARFWPAVPDDAAAADLASLWGLPLFRYDDVGQLRRALAESWETGLLDDGRWFVDVRLRPGSWSDGRPVVAEDVVATVAALKSAGSVEFDVVRAVEARSQREARFVFDLPYTRWPHLLAGGAGVLPAHVISEAGIGAFTAGVPVSGGWFTLSDHVPGRSLTFAAHVAGPLGPPSTAEVVVDLVPAFETALGLLDAGEVDVVMGYLALNPVGRAEVLDGVAAAAPLGGTSVAIRWRDDGPLGGPARVVERRGLREVIDVEDLVEALLRETGEAATSVIPGRPGPWEGPAAAPTVERTASLLVPRWQEVPGFTARALQRAVRARGGGLELVRLEPDDLVTEMGSRGDGALLIRRDGPWPSLAAMAGAADAAVVDAAVLADRGTRPDSTSAAAADAALYDDATWLPLYRIGVAHAWRAEALTLRPSSWPGLGLWDVGMWDVGPRIQ